MEVPGHDDGGDVVVAGDLLDGELQLSVGGDGHHAHGDGHVHPGVRHAVGHAGPHGDGAGGGCGGPAAGLGDVLATPWSAHSHLEMGSSFP